MDLMLLLQASNPADEIGAMTSYTLDIIKFLFLLGGVLILTYVAVRFWLPRYLSGGSSLGGPIQVVTRMPLEPRKSLYIIRVGTELFLIGTSEGQLHYLTSLDPDKTGPLQNQLTREPRAGDFASFLKSFRRSKEGSPRG